MVLGEVIVFEYWCNNTEIQAAYKMLYDDVYKEYRYSQHKFKVTEMVEWIKNDPCMSEEMKNNAEFIQHDFITTTKRVFDKDAYAPKTFYEIYEGICIIYSRMIFANATPWEEREETEAALKTLTAKMKTIADENTMFGFNPRFYLENEVSPDCFFFYPVFFKPNAAKVYVEVTAEGIKAWLQYNKINDKFFNPAPKKPEIEISKPQNPSAQSTNESTEQSTDNTLKSDVPPADGSKETSTYNPRKGWPDPFKGLSEKRRDYTKYMGCLLKYERQYNAFSLRFEYELEMPEIEKRMGITRQAIDQLLAKAKKRIDSSSKK